MSKSDFCEVNQDVLHGTPVFGGTRVPIETLFDYLATGDSLEEFLLDFPTVKREQAEAAIDYSKQLAVA